MHRHRGNMKSGAFSTGHLSEASELPHPQNLKPIAVAAANNETDASFNQSTVPSHARITVEDSQLNEVVSKELQTSSTVSTSTKSTSPVNPCRLLSLPDELQTAIYELAVVEKTPIHLNNFITSRGHKKLPWRITFSVNGWIVPRPTLLAVCKYLRSFVAPIYYSGNTFSAIRGSDFGELKKLRVLPTVLGNHAKHIRKFDYWVKMSIYFTSYHVPTLYPNGLEKTDPDIPLVIKMKLLPGGTLVLQRWSPGTRAAGNLPEGEMCPCDLHRVAATIPYKGIDSRRLFEMTKYCVLRHKESARVTTCTRCNRPSLGEMKPVLEAW